MAPAFFVDSGGLTTTMSSFLGSALYQQSVQHHYLQQCSSFSSLDGYAFNCDGIVIGFHDQNLYCQGANGGNTFDCGTFDYDGLDLTGSSTIFKGPFETSHLYHQDGLLVSFVVDEMTTCHVVSLDWHNYSLVDYLGLQCPIQNANVGLEENHFAFGVSGDVALRSPLEISETKIVRDSYGVYQWLDNDVIKLYFGPQQGRLATVLKGTLTNNELHVDGYEPSGPCTHDGTSTLVNTDSLPQLPKPQGVAVKAIGGLVRLVSWNTVGVEGLWTLCKNTKSWFLMLGCGGVTTIPALSMTVTAFLNEVLFKRDGWPPRITIHPSFIPLFDQYKKKEKTQ